MSSLKKKETGKEGPKEVPKKKVVVEENVEDSDQELEEDDDEEEGEGEGEDNDEDEEEEEDEEDERVPIDLSENEVYRGVCTLFEDEDGNNILEYISLLHTELIGINKSLENLKSIRKDISRLADCAEVYLKGKKATVEEHPKKASDDVPKKKKTST